MLFYHWEIKHYLVLKVEPGIHIIDIDSHFIRKTVQQTVRFS